MDRRAALMAMAAGSQALGQPAEEDAPELEAFTIEALEKKRGARAYLSFLKRDTLHCGIYVLEKGATDGQQPHSEDEVYYVLEGSGKFTVDGEKTVDAVKGTVLFVAAKAGHRFHDIEETLKLLVFFSRAKV